MNDDVKRARIAKYFRPTPRAAFVLMGACAILFVAGGALAEKVLMGAGAVGIFAGVALWAWMSGLRPTEVELDGWLAEDTEGLLKRARQKLGLREEETIADPIVVGPGFLFAGWEEAKKIEPEHLAPNAWRIGHDGALRLGAFRYQAFFPTAKFLGSYTCSYDFCEGKSCGERTEEFFYRDIVSVTTRQESRKVAWLAPKGAAGKALGIGREEREEEFGDFETFRLTVSSGDFVEVAVSCEEPQKKLLGRKAALKGRSCEQAVAAIRRFLREKK